MKLTYSTSLYEKTGKLQGMSQKVQKYANIG